MKRTGPPEKHWVGLVLLLVVTALASPGLRLHDHASPAGHGVLSFSTGGEAPAFCLALHPALLPAASPPSQILLPPLAIPEPHGDAVRADALVRSPTAPRAPPPSS